MFDVILERWKLDLVGEKPSTRRLTSQRAHLVDPSSSKQPSLFDSPITLRSDELTVVIKRKGSRLVASIEILADVEIA